MEIKGLDVILSGGKNTIDFMLLDEIGIAELTYSDVEDTLLPALQQFVLAAKEGEKINRAKRKDSIKEHIAQLQAALDSLGEE